MHANFWKMEPKRWPKNFFETRENALSLRFLTLHPSHSIISLRPLGLSQLLIPPRELNSPRSEYMTYDFPISSTPSQIFHLRVFIVCFVPFQSLSKISNRAGAAIVELAVVLPVLLLMLIGTIEACAAIHLQQLLDITAYEAARTSLLPKNTTLAVQTAANKFLASRNTKNANVSISPANFESATIGTTITITVSAPTQSNLPISPFFFKNRTITSTCSMMKEYQ